MQREFSCEVLPAFWQLSNFVVHISVKLAPISVSIYRGGFLLFLAGIEVHECKIRYLSCSFFIL